MSTHIAYFYDPRSAPTEGWYDRLTLACDEEGNLVRSHSIREVAEGGWQYIGHWERGKAPDSAWGPARVPPG